MLSKSSSNLEAQIFYTSGINKLFPLGKHAIVPTFINKVVLQPRYKDLYEIRGLKGFPCGSAGKESTYNAGDLGSIPGLGRNPGEGKGCPPQYSGLENSMDKAARQATVHGVAQSWTQLSDFQKCHINVAF